MRISEQTSFRLINDSIALNQDAVHRIQAQVSSGRKVLAPSDDPGAYEAIERMTGELSSLSRFQENAVMAEVELLSFDSVLQNVQDLLQRTSELAISSSDATLTDQDLEAIAAQVDNVLTSIVDAGNTFQNGRFIFGGLRSDTKPYDAVDSDGDGMIDSVSYNGGTGVREIEIGQGSYVTVNIPGSDPSSSGGVFQTDSIDIFQTLITFRDNLLSGTPTAETDTLDQLEKCQEHVLDTLAIVGAREGRVRLGKETLSEWETGLRTLLDEKESIDVAQAIMELSEKQLAYEAALRAAATMLDSDSLIDLL